MINLIGNLLKQDDTNNKLTTISAGLELGGNGVITGGSAASGTLTLSGTSNATKGPISLNPNGGTVRIGSNPATTGMLNLPNNQYIYARNAANSADVNIIGLNTSDVIQIGTSLDANNQLITGVYGIYQYNSLWYFSDNGDGLASGNFSVGSNYFGLGAVPKLYVEGAGSTSATTNTLFSNSSGTALFFVDNGGNVGIGTPTPSYRLHVSGNSNVDPVAIIQQTNIYGHGILQFDRASNVRGAALMFSTSGTADWYSGVLYNNGQPATSYMIATNNDVDDAKLVITTAGNVGIGTSTVLTPKLNVVSNDGVTVENIASSLTTTVSTTTGVFAGNFAVYADPSGTSTANYTGVQGTARTLATNGQNVTGSLRGLNFNIRHQGTGTVSTAQSIIVQNIVNGGGIITNAYDLYLTAPSVSGTGSAITNAYGLYIQSHTQGTNLNYNIYSQGPGTNYFGGAVGIGITAPASGTDLHIGDAAGSVITLQRTDSSVTANDIVGKIQFNTTDTSTTTNPTAAEIEVQATNTVATDINPGRIIFRTTPVGVAATPTESFRITEAQNLQFNEVTDFIFGTTTGSKIGTATNQKIAFHNATPVIQRAGAAQAAVATTGATNTTPYGYTTAAQANAIVTLVNEIRAALVEKGIIKGAA